MSTPGPLKRAFIAVAEYSKETRQDIADYLRGHVEDAETIICVAPHFAKAAMLTVPPVALSVITLGATVMTVQAAEGRIFPATVALSLGVAVYDSAKRCKRNWKSAMAKLDAKLDSFLTNPIKLDL